MATPPIPEHERLEIIRLYESGLSVNAVTAVVRASKSTVSKTLTEAGVLRAKGWDCRKKETTPEPPPPEEEDDPKCLSWRVIPALVEEGLPVPSVAKMLNVGEDYVELCLRRASSEALG